MTELALILGIQVVALAYALVVGRGVVSAESAHPLRLRRLETALERATLTFSAKQGRVLLIAVPCAASALFGLHFQLGQGSGLGRPAAGAVAAFGLCIGACFAWLAARFALKVGVASSLRSAAAASKGLDSALGVAMRAGAASAIASEALSALGLTLLFGSTFALLGGTTFAPKAAASLSAEVVAALASFPLGAALAALVCQRSGGTFQAAAAIGRDVAGEQKFGLARDDPRNPTLVGGLAGDQLGESATRAAIGFATVSTSQVALLALGLGAVAGQEHPPVQLVLLPFVVRAFFSLATGFGANVVRTEEMRSPSGGLLRGYASTTFVGLSGVFGASLWLAREHLWEFFGAGALGSAMGLAVALPVWSRLLRPAAALRDTSEALRLSGGAAALLSLGGALELALLPTAAVGLGTALAWLLGTHTGLEHGGWWTTLIAWAALLGAAPFAAAVSAVGTAAAGARAAAALGALDVEAQRRAARLDETSAVAASARAQLILSSVGSAVLAAFALPSLAKGALRVDIATLEPIVTWSGALGAAFVVGYAGSAARSAVRGGREVALEVDRQLRRFPREQGVAQVPTDFSPSYKACVDVATRLGEARLFGVALAPLAAPALLALVLRLACRGEAAGRAIDGLASCVLFAGLFGFTAAFALDAARALLTAAQRVARSPATLEPFGPINADGTADVYGHAAGPAALAFLVGTAALALAIAPFMN